MRLRNGGLLRLAGTFAGLGLLMDCSAALAAPRHLGDPLDAGQVREVGGSLPLTLVQAIAMAVKGNRTLEKASIDRNADKADLAAAESRFDPQWSLGGGATRRVAGFGGSNATVSPGVSIATPLGGQIGASLQGGSLGSGAYGSLASVTLAQPLLRGAGTEVNEAPVTIARSHETIAQLQLRQTVSDTIAAVIGAYRELLRAQEARKLAEAALKRSQTFVDVDRSLISAGRMPAVEVVQAEADLEAQKLSVLQVQASIAADRLALAGLLNVDLSTQIVAVDKLDPQPLKLPLGKALTIAFDNRPDYGSQMQEVEQARLGLDVARNQRLWDVSLLANGQAGKSIGRGNGGLRSELAPTAAVGVAFSMPFDDAVGVQPVIHATTSLEGARLQLSIMRTGVEQQVRASLTDIDLKWQQIEALRRVRDLAASAVDIEREKLAVGRSTTFQVDTLHANLRAVEGQQLEAAIAYLTALTTLDLELGTLCRTWNVALRD